MGQQGISDFRYPQLISLSRYNDITNVPYDPELDEEFDRFDIFNLKKFNADFQTKKESRELINNLTNREKISKLEYEANEPELKPELKPWEIQQFTNILANIKNTWFGILDDLIMGEFNVYIFTKSHRAFYIGLTIILFIIIFWIWSFVLY